MTDTAVLLMAYGGPETLDDIPAYLLDVRGGRETPQHLVDEITSRYRQIGGRSPLLDITRRVAARLGEKTELPVYVGMRHWHPYIAETVAQMSEDGIRHVVGICMAPYYSAMSIGAYRKKLDEALAAHNPEISLTFVDHWGTQPDYLEGVAANVRQTLTRFPEADRAGVKIVFSAHSLPASILERGDPYVDQLDETARLLAVKLALPDDRWMFSFQSAAQTGTPWLGPAIEDVIPQLAAQGERNVLIAPVGFIADHVEVLYDLDIGVQVIARQHNVRVERTPMLNDSPALIDALGALVGENAAITGGAQ